MVWRDPDTLQIGIDPRRAVALRGMRGMEALINLLDGSRDRAELAREMGSPVEVLEVALAVLERHGTLTE